jgi:benzoate membrane transport protein
VVDLDRRGRDRDVLSWTAREPIITAWSTPAAAFLITALATTPYAEAVGAYLISAAAFVALGLSGTSRKSSG